MCDGNMGYNLSRARYTVGSQKKGQWRNRLICRLWVSTICKQHSAAQPSSRGQGGLWGSGGPSVSLLLLAIVLPAAGMMRTVFVVDTSRGQAGKCEERLGAQNKRQPGDLKVVTDAQLPWGIKIVAYLHKVNCKMVMPCQPPAKRQSMQSFSTEGCSS